MTLSHLKKSALVVLVNAFSLMITSCHDNNDNNQQALAVVNALDDLPVVADNTIIVQVIDVSSGSAVTSDVTVTPVANDTASFSAQEILAMLESPLANAASSGLSLFELSENVDPSADPFDIAFLANGSGYLQNSVTVTIDTVGESQVTISLVPLSEDTFQEGGAEIADGIGVKVDTIESNDGSVPQPFANSVDNGVDLDGDGEVSELERFTTSFTIPTAVVMQNENGQPVTGTLTAATAQFVTASEEALRSLPGSFEPELTNLDEFVSALGRAVTSQAGKIDVAFSAFTAIEITNENGERVTDFVPPASAVERNDNGDIVRIVEPDALPKVNVQIPIGTLDNNDNIIIPTALLEPGEEQVIAVMSYDERSGQWLFESESSKFALVTDEDVDDGMLDVSYPITHLSVYALLREYSSESRCSKRITIVDELNQSLYPQAGELLIRSQAGGSVSSSYTPDSDGVVEITATQIDVDQYSQELLSALDRDPRYSSVLENPDSFDRLISRFENRHSTRYVFTSADGYRLASGRTATPCDSLNLIEIPVLEAVTTDIDIQVQSSCSNIDQFPAGVAVPEPAVQSGILVSLQRVENERIQPNSQQLLDTVEGSVTFQDVTSSIQVEGAADPFLSEFEVRAFDSGAGQWTSPQSVTPAETSSVLIDIPQVCEITTGATSGAGSL